jgi:molybdopterin-containing oxidoreductase family iron-sulfur binding subunit
MPPLNKSEFVPLSEVRTPPASGEQGARKPQYWRSLDERPGTEEYQQYVKKEFPVQAPGDMQPLKRRDFLRLMGATLALAGVGGCAYQPAEKIVPYVEQPELIIPGKPLYYTTAFLRGGYAHPVLGETHMGRPVKLEGNPDHPASMGATDAYTQASILTLYDPDRSQAARHLGDPASWDAFMAALVEPMDALRARKGAGLRVLTGATTSPTLAGQVRKLLAKYPQAKVYQYEPLGQESARAGARAAFGQDAQPVYNFKKAQRILSLDADFLLEEPGSVRYSRDFMDGRRVTGGRKEMNRLYVVESAPTLTGANADHRLALRPSQVEVVARAVAGALGAGAAAGAPSVPPEVPPEWIPALVEDLKAHRGTSLVIAGSGQPPVVHTLAHAINNALGNTGPAGTVSFIAPVEVSFGDPAPPLRQLVDEMNKGQVEILLILSCNPVYNAPADIEFGTALRNFNHQKSAFDPNPDPARKRNNLSVHLGLYDDETGVECQWHLPESHYLESWSDARAFDGSAGIIQPLIMPLYSSHSVHELLSLLVDDDIRPGYDIVRENWMATDPRFVAAAGAATTGGGTVSPAGGGGGSVGGGAQAGGSAGANARGQAPAASAEFEHFWHKALTSGTVPGQAPAAKTLAFNPNALAAPGTAPGAPASPPVTSGGMEIIFRPDPTIWDGTYSNNAWLQELPKPFTSLTWDNAAYVSIATAKALGVNDRDLVELAYQGRTLRVPVWRVPGHPDNAVTLTLGYGRTQAGEKGTGTGFNAYALRTSSAPWFGGGLEVRKVGGSYNLVSMQRHFSMEGRDLVRVGTLEQWERNSQDPEFMRPEGERDVDAPPSLYPNMWPSDREKPEGANPRDPGTWEGKERAVGPVPGAPLPAWGMVIDLNTCIGCSACTMACQAENNIATVGKQQVEMHRAMHWIRIDNYFVGEDASPETVFQPVPCMHCEKAPCEPVCPVEATTHSAEGINEMTYNRCVGTRYCQNNCPYKVRRFNYLQYSDQQTPVIQMMRNPDVTVRSRGVMEKCTYCIQRITLGRIEAEKEDRGIRDGDVVTACQQVCPTQAITFGDVNDRSADKGKGSKVRQLKEEPTNYTLLNELNTRPRTSYLARLRNYNPALAHLAAHGTEGKEGH